MICGCTPEHPTYGAHLRDKNIRVAYCQSWKGQDATAARRTDRELSEYKSARDQGIQPTGTGLHQTRAALDMSDHMGRPFDGANLTSNLEL